MPERLRGVTGEGLLGTGTFLLDVRETTPGAFEASAWFCVLFLPLVPRGAWTLRAERPGFGRLAWEPQSFDLMREATRPPEARGMLAAWGRALAVLVGALAPAAWTFLRIEQTGVLPAIRLVIAVLVPLYVAARLDYSLVRVRRARDASA
jgi:hypothetical protein